MMLPAAPTLFGREPVDPLTMACYADLLPWAAALCEENFITSLAHGRRRRAARVDFVAGWKEAARSLGRHDVFREAAR